MIDAKGDVPQKREGHRAILKDNHLYITGGCNYSINNLLNTTTSLLHHLNYF